MKFAVATKAVILNPKGEVLILVKSNKDEINPKTADIPGGRLKFSEKIEDCLKREIEEETSIKEINIIAPSKTWSLIKDDMHLVGITFAVTTNTYEVKTSFEHESFSWLSPEEILESNLSDWIKEEVRAALKIASQN
ncbi:TPA: hypothetical protein DDW69_02970 [candidate division CPR2 bacterium]|uniref:Putative hydrolase n=1 Tax=candidate division CPR2 bacterium GW2011_GWC1_41_48 TaxID=1618344 RepID=A0A0G0W838_UNCC2|nr:MAG: putative hydrolase [candidate division CPR2 bacterium GW2011_GWC2_39_35]KKR29207.1 MAG: putative hydrolase [candidate division CPR2 bacterium GW2011_GWD2_39_7]KKS09149.1 MAG: putative hydrolase [candidate division CPR2 bacterium GW2011_GWC1_41_48]OGB70761.1 MAG: hypothetical protein A2Y26_02695 [candidate division CPR2 bacterium GWD2_39_7]HBG81779.1 hypothetical protein [candidate division CPR2 bacterium]